MDATGTAPGACATGVAELGMEDGALITTNFIGAGGTGRGKFELFDGDGDGMVDLLIGTPRHHSMPNSQIGLPRAAGMCGATVLFLKNTGTNQAVKALSETKLFGQNNALTFAVDRETRKPVLRIVDRQTNPVVRQIPPESVLQLAADLKLIEAHLQQTDLQLIEVIGLLSAVLDGWEECRPDVAASPAPRGGYQQTAPASAMHEKFREEYAPPADGSVSLAPPASTTRCALPGPSRWTNSSINSISPPSPGPRAFMALGRA